MALFKVFSESNVLVGEYPSHAKMLLALRRFENDGAAWVEDEEGRRSLYLVTPAGIAQVTPHVIELVQRGLKAQLTAAQQDADDAAKWRAWVGSGRIRILGAAGLTPGQPSYETPHAHICLEIWNAYPGADPQETTGARQLLEAYVAKVSGAPRPADIITPTED